MMLKRGVIQDGGSSLAPRSPTVTVKMNLKDVYLQGPDYKHLLGFQWE